MTALSQDMVADLRRRIAELEQKLEASIEQREAAVERQTATALVNFRLQNELRASRERQHASAEILRAIAASPVDAEQSLQRIAETAARFFNAPSVSIRIAEGDEWVKTVRVGASAHLTGAQPSAQSTARGKNLPATVYRDNRQIHIPDLDNIDPSMADWPAAIARAGGIRTICGTPLRCEGKAIGSLVVHRDRLAPFTPDELALQQSFADQAVIAIENARLFNETREALERQTATADILKVIASSPAEVQPVFDVIVERAVHLCGARMGRVYRYDGELIHMVGGHGLSDSGRDSAKRPFPRPASDDTIAGSVMLSREPKIVADVELDDTVPALSREMILSIGARSQVTMPMLLKGEPIGAISLSWTESHGYNDQQIALLQTFADQAVIAVENVRLFNETREALERQTATAEILKVIASSPSDVQPVFDGIVNSAASLFEQCTATITTLKEGKLHWNALATLRSDFDMSGTKAVYPLPFDPERSPSARAMLERRIIEIPDTASPDTPEFTRQASAAGGFRSATFVPLVHRDTGFGTIILTHPQAGFRLSEKHLTLVQTFADQAVIAIENTRLFNETREALERQTATADILKVMASSPSDVQPVFDAIATSANRLLSGFSSTVFLFIDGMAHLGACTPTTPQADEILKSTFPQPIAYFAPIRIAQTGEVVQVPDTEALTDELKDVARARGYRSMLFAPLVNKGASIGFIAVTRVQTGTFDDHHVQLLKTFADQAVIAIENVRLFEEVQAKTRDLEESLQQQTATSEVLQIISASPGDLAPVFEKMLENATRVCGAEFGSMNLLEDGAVRQAALYNAPPAFAAARADTIRHPHPKGALAKAIESKQVAHVADVRTTAAYLEGSQNTVELAELGGARTIAVVPMLRDDEVIGTITIYRQEIRLFDDKQIELVSNFAKQAVIAIENARLLRELRQRTADLSESLQQQTATADVLKVIASSPTDVGPVLRAIVESACELCEAHDALLALKSEGELVVGAHHGPIPVSMTKWANDRKSISGRSVADRCPIQLQDILSSEGDEFPVGQEMSRRDGCRTMLGVPLLREGDAIGAILLRRTEVHPFNETQIALLQTFADQAVIAIGNVHLFEEVQAKSRDLEESLQHQTATSEVLQVISSSMADAQPVFERILDSAERLFDCRQAGIFLAPGDGLLHLVGQRGPDVEPLRRVYPRPIEETTVPVVLGERRQKYFPDVMNGTDVPESLRHAGQAMGNFSVVITPMLWEGRGVGVISVTREPNTAFNTKELNLLQTFADQAVIAIENARLFNELQTRTQELAQSLDDLRTAQGRLIQTEKLASLGQLTAGIAHEIKNPLNFVNNFAALSAELTDELKDVLKAAALAETIRAEVNELTGTLKENLSKVVQHGRRADSIVKNMLLHSRAGSGEHRRADINALVDESLNLAYHGARAETSLFNVTLQRNFDPKGGMIEVFPQEITRVFLNLISNGFYAVTKRKSENGSGGFEPIVRATTLGRDDHVEIKIRDNGTGIPPEVKERMFNPFFTTKPAGEGTGLGLSISHDIVVKQHGGTIDVETEPGSFTEFTIKLPRTSNPSSKV
jgi:GAF domain-containing protein